MTVGYVNSETVCQNSEIVCQSRCQGLMYTCEGSLKKSLFSLSEIDLLKSEMYIVTPLTAAIIIALTAMLADSCGNQIRRHVVQTGLRGLKQILHRRDPPLPLPPHCL